MNTIGQRPPPVPIPPKTCRKGIIPIVPGSDQISVTAVLLTPNPFVTPAWLWTIHFAFDDATWVPGDNGVVVTNSELSFAPVLFNNVPVSGIAGGAADFFPVNYLAVLRNGVEVARVYFTTPFPEV